jgi:hypothetical protein
MRRNRFIYLILIALCCGCLAVPAGAGGWTWERPIITGITEPGFIGVPLPDDVFGMSRPDLHDLRIFDADGSPVRYLLQWGKERGLDQETWRNEEIIRTENRPGKYSRYYFTENSYQKRKCLFQIELPGHNYHRRAVFEYQDIETGNWELAGKSWLFDIRDPGHYVLNTVTVSFPPCHKMRMTLYNMPDEQGRIHLLSLKRRETHERGSDSIPVMIQQPLPYKSDEDNRTVIELDLENANLPLEYLELDIAEEWFHRGITISGKNSLPESDAPWHRINSRVIYSIREETRFSRQTMVYLHDIRRRFLRVEIENGDNPPLSIRGVNIFRRNVRLLLPVKDSRNLVLRGGNPDAEKPEFDIRKSIRDIEEINAHEAMLGPVAMLAPPIEDGQEVTCPWTERNTWIIWIMLLAGIGVMGGIVVINLRNLNREEKGPVEVVNADDLDDRSQ